MEGSLARGPGAQEGEEGLPTERWPGVGCQSPRRLRQERVHGGSLAPGVRTHVSRGKHTLGGVAWQWAIRAQGQHKGVRAQHRKEGIRMREKVETHYIKEN